MRLEFELVGSVKQFPFLTWVGIIKFTEILNGTKGRGIGD